MTDKSRFLIHTERGAPLTDFLAVAVDDPDITVVDIIGPRELPHTALIEISNDKARLLEQQFRLSGNALHQLSIEPDQPLSLFDSDLRPF